MATGQRVRQRGAVNHLQLTAYRHAVGDTAGFNAILRAKLGDIVSRGFPLHRRVGSEDNFGQLLRFQTLLKPIEANIVRADAVQR